MPYQRTRRDFIQTAAASGIVLPGDSLISPCGGGTEEDAPEPKREVPLAGTSRATPRIAAIDYRTQNEVFNDPATVQLHARHAYAILGMLPSQSTAAGRQFCLQLKNANPTIKIGQYTLLSQMYDAGSTYQLLWQAINAGDGIGHDWWARAAANSPVAPGGKTKPAGYESYAAWSVNQTSYAPADPAGKRWPQKCAEGYYTLTLQGLWNVNVLDFVFNDNVWPHPHAESDASTYISCLSTSELNGVADYAFIEGLSGKSWSPATFTTMANVMMRYRSQLKSVKTTVFVNSYVDSVSDSLGRTLQKARFGLALSMLDDGYACIADQPAGATMRPYWIDELGAGVGSAIESPPTAPLANGMWMRRYQYGYVVLNPMDNGGPVTLVRASNVVTLTRSNGVPQKKPGDKVRIQDCNDASFNGVFTLTAVTPTSLQWTQVGSNTALLAQPTLKGFFETLGTLNLTGQGYKRVFGTQDAHNASVDGGTSQNDGTAAGVLSLWSNDAILLLKN